MMDEDGELNEGRHELLTLSQSPLSSTLQL